MEPTNKIILAELHEIKQELDYIKKHMVDADTILTPDEEEKLDTSLKEYREGRTTSLEKLKKEIGV